MQDTLRAALLLCLLSMSLAIYLPPAPEARDNEAARNRTLRETACSRDEYEANGICCLMCPAGSYVAQHCKEDHAQGLCSPCTKGYAAGPNGLQVCQRCRACRKDEEMVRKCTATTNSKCQCKPGTYCPPEDPCEICTRCSRCNEGQRVKEACTPTQDTVCENLSGNKPTSTPTTSLPTTNTTPPHRQLTSLTKHNTPDPGEGSATLAIVFAALVIVLLALIGFLVYWFRFRDQNEPKPQTGSENSLCQSAISSSCSTPLMDKSPLENAKAPPEEKSLIPIVDNVKLCKEVHVTARPPDTEGHDRNLERCEDSGDRADEDDEGGGGVRPCGECDLPPLCNHQWTTCIYTITGHVDSKTIIHLARHLDISDHTIDCIKESCLLDIKERNYQLLKHWRDKEGQKASIKTIISKLNGMNLAGCGENIINSLRRKGIPIM